MTKKINVYFLLFFLASFVFSVASRAEIDNLFSSLKKLSFLSPNIFGDNFIEFKLFNDS